MNNFIIKTKNNLKNDKGDILEILKVIITSAVSLIVLFLLTKLVGNKQLSELNMFDYIVSITIGSIAAEMATELENPEIISFGVSVWCSKSITVRRIVFGKSVVLMQNGKLFRKNFKKCRLDLSEFLMQCRLNGFYDLSAVDTAVMEASGKISFMPASSKRPVTPEDLNIVPSGAEVFYSVIMDGKIFEYNLKSAGRDLNWLKNELKVQGVKSKKEVYFAALDKNGTLNVFKNTDEKQNNDIFE